MASEKKTLAARHQLYIAGSLCLILAQQLLMAGPLQASVVWNWSDEFLPWQGCDGPIHALARTSSGLLYIGGEFSACGTVAAANLVRFNPGTGEFSPIIVNDINGVSGRVQALVVDGSNLYVGGFFSHAGDLLVNRIARFDGTNWHAFGQLPSVGLGNLVTSLAVHNGELYAGGTFTSGGGTTLGGIARWDGSAWDSLGGGLSGSGLASVNDIVIHPDPPLRLYATGNFSSAGDVTVNHVARWDGTTWHALAHSSGEVGMNSAGSALVLLNDDLIVGGSFSMAGGQNTGTVARFDGSNWMPVGSQSLAGVVQTLTLQSGALIAGGSFPSADGVPLGRIARFDGSEWQPLQDLSAGVNSDVLTILAVGANIIIGGRFSQAGGRDASGLARWNGERFFSFTSANGIGVHGEINAMARFGGDLIVTGQFKRAGASLVENIARYDGESWHPLGPGLFGGGLTLLARDESLYVGGQFFPGPNQPGGNISRWDGSQWHALGEGLNGAVHALAWHDEVLHAGGNFTGSGTADVKRVARFDGTNWLALGDGEDNGVNGIVNAMASYADALFIGGLFSLAGGAPASRIARWHEGQWSALGTGADNNVLAMVVHQDELIVAGAFNSVDGVTTGRVAGFDGSQWRALGNPAPAALIRALASAGPWLFAAGNFNTATGQTGEHLAILDGSGWTRLGQAQGTGGNWEIRSLWIDGTFEDDLPPAIFAGGRFGQAGPHTAANLTRLFPLPDVLFRSRFE